MSRLAGADWRLYLVTDTQQSASRGRTVPETVRQAVAGGVGVVQVRDKDLPDAEFRALTLEVAEAIEAGRAARPDGPGPRVPLFLNDRAEVASALIGEGFPVHLHIGQDDTDPARARELIGQDALLGLSAASPEELARAAGEPVDLLGVGAVWATTTKPDAPEPLGVDTLTARVAAAPLPCVAIGGITRERAGSLRPTGVIGICVVSAICAAPDPAAAARGLLEAFTPAATTRPGGAP